jgi:hypothetical protein
MNPLNISLFTDEQAYIKSWVIIRKDPNSPAVCALRQRGDQLHSLTTVAKWRSFHAGMGVIIETY